MQILTLTAAASVLALSVSAGCGVASGTAHLELNPGAGRTTRFELSLSQDITQTMMGVEREHSQTIRYGLTQTMSTPNAEGHIEMGIIYDWISMDMVMPGPLGSVSVDSRDPGSEQDPLNSALTAVAGTGFNMKVTQRGEIISVDGVTEMLDAMFSELDGEGEVGALREAMQKMFGDDALKDFMQPFVSIYPDREVAVGDTWERRHEVTAGYSHVQENVYELLERTDEACQVHLDSRLTSPDNAAPVDMGVFKFKMSLAGTQEGVLKLELGTGLVLESQIESDLEGTMEIIGEDMEPWPITLHQELTMRAVD